MQSHKAQQATVGPRPCHSTLGRFAVLTDQGVAALLNPRDSPDP